MNGDEPFAPSPLRVAAVSVALAELDEVRPFPDFLADLRGRAPDFEPLLDLIREKEECTRAEAALRAEAAACRRLGWRLFRPLVAVSLLGAAVFVLQRVISPVLGVSLFLAGVGAMYAGTQVLLALRERAAARRIGEVHSYYRARLRPLLAESDARVAGG